MTSREQASFWDAETETFNWDSYNKLVEARKRLKANYAQLEDQMEKLHATFIGLLGTDE